MLCQARRRFSSQAKSPLVVVEHHLSRENHLIATLTLNAPPVNSLSLEMLSALRDTISEIEASSCRGFVLASSHPTIFSAGLDIRELHEPDEMRLRDFWSALQDAFLALYGTRCASVAAIDGHAPAGGCLLASACDERIMATGNFGIGLNETKIGIVAPFWFADALYPLIGQRNLERMLQLGSLLSPKEALEVGLVDTLTEHGGGNPINIVNTPVNAGRNTKREQEEEEEEGPPSRGHGLPGFHSPVLREAHKVLEDYISIDPAARAASKLLMRSATLRRLQERKQDDLESFVAFCLSPGYQANVKSYLAGLKNRKRA